jgi:hypothetical protein
VTCERRTGAPHKNDRSQWPLPLFLHSSLSRRLGKPAVGWSWIFLFATLEAWPHGASVSTLAFQAGTMGSTPIGAATFCGSSAWIGKTVQRLEAGIGAGANCCSLRSRHAARRAKALGFYADDRFSNPSERRKRLNKHQRVSSIRMAGWASVKSCTNLSPRKPQVVRTTTLRHSRNLQIRKRPNRLTFFTFALPPSRPKYGFDSR